MLGDVHPPAMVALRQIRADKTSALLRGEKDRELFHDVASINWYLGEQTSTYKLFRKLAKETPTFAQQCFALAIDAIVSAKDFGLAAQYSPDPESALVAFSDDLNRDVVDHRSSPPVKAPRLDAYIRIYCGRVLNTIQILKGVGHNLDSKLAREWAVALVDDRRVRNRVETLLYSKMNS
jgi:hypothetical protein